MTDFVSHQVCPRCSGAIDTEHFADERMPRDAKSQVLNRVTLMYCEFCNVGWETLWVERSDAWAEDFTCEFSKASDPVKLGMFLQRLRSARCAA